MSNSSKYYDNLAAQVVLGNLVLHPHEVLSADSMYPLSSRDFVPTFHKAMFGGLYNFAMTGRDATDIATFEEFLKDYPDLWGSYSTSGVRIPPRMVLAFLRSAYTPQREEASNTTMID